MKSKKKLPPGHNSCGCVSNVCCPHQDSTEGLCCNCRRIPEWCYCDGLPENKIDKGCFIANVKEDDFHSDPKKKLTLSQRLRRWSSVNFQGGDIEFYKRSTQKLMNEAADFIEKREIEK